MRHRSTSRALYELLSSMRFAISLLTILGIANAIVSIMMIPVTAFPFGKELIDRDDPRARFATSLLPTR